MAIGGALAVTVFAVHGIGVADSSPAVGATSVIPNANSGGARPVATAAISTSAATHSAAAVPTVSATPSLSNASSSPAILWGTLDTQTSTAATEDKAGVTMAMLELNWASFEPSPGEVSASYVASVRSDLAAYRAAGMKVTLGLGMHYTPSWVFDLPDSKYVDQNGDTSTEANFVFSAAVRQAADTYLTLVSRSLPLSGFWAIRLTSGGDEEMLYPPGGTYWAFDNAALTGNGLAAGVPPNPYPNWRPGNAGLSQAQINSWVNWYIGGLVNVTTWQMGILSSLGFAGYYETVTPGSGTRPDTLARTEEADLSNDGTTGGGAVWDRFYAALKGRSDVIAYISSVADMSGDNDGCTAADDNIIPLTSTAMDSWSATRWISRIAASDALLVGGENSGWGTSAALNAQYTNTGPDGMMANAVRQARSCHFSIFYWAHDVHLWDGTLPFSLYRSMIAGEH